MKKIFSIIILLTLLLNLVMPVVSIAEENETNSKNTVNENIVDNEKEDEENVQSNESKEETNTSSEGEKENDNEIKKEENKQEKNEQEVEQEENKQKENGQGVEQEEINTISSKANLDKIVNKKGLEGTYIIETAIDKSKCLDIYRELIDNGANLQLYS